MASVLTPFGLSRQPGGIVFGPGVRASLAALVRPLGDSALLCTDERMAASAEFAGIRTALEQAGVRTITFDGTRPDLPREDIERLAQEVGGQQVDVVIGIGGGSCLDMAKVAAVVLTHGGDVADYYGEFKVPGPCLPVVMVPTTAGTGAEMTCISVIYDPDLQMKVGIASPHLQARVAVVDPELVLSCPPGLTAASGADALSHLVEAFTARVKPISVADTATTIYVGKNVLADTYCRAGFELMARSLERAYRQPRDLVARADTMLAATYAGMAINTTGTAAAHALQSPIGALTHTPHGVGVGALLPYVMRFNLPARVAEFAALGAALGVADRGAPEGEQARSAVLAIDTLLASLDIPADLDALGLDRGAIETVAGQALSATRLTANNPVEMTDDNVRALLERAFTGDRSWQ